MDKLYSSLFGVRFKYDFFFFQRTIGTVIYTMSGIVQVARYRKLTQLISTNNISSGLIVRCASTSKKVKKPNYLSVKTVNSVGASLASKGFLRSHKPYTAPDNVTEQIKSICTSLKMPTDVKYSLHKLNEKFEFIDECYKNFNYSIPNSQIYEMKTVGDVIAFYERNVDTTTPFDALKQMELPKNLYIQSDYVRFNAETDTKFNGKTAFPKSSTLVTGLKYRDKYPGNVAKRSWP